jgi:hypothetical protein
VNVRMKLHAVHVGLKGGAGSRDPMKLYYCVARNC